MKTQINTGNHIAGCEALSQHAETIVASVLAHLNEPVARVEVHPRDKRGTKTGGRDNRCMMEARLEGH